MKDRIDMVSDLNKIVHKYGFQEITNRDAASVGVAEATLFEACARGKAKLVGEWPHLDIRMFQVFA